MTRRSPPSFYMPVRLRHPLPLPLLPVLLVYQRTGATLPPLLLQRLRFHPLRPPRGPGKIFPLDRRPTQSGRLAMARPHLPPPQAPLRPSPRLRDWALSLDHRSPPPNTTTYTSETVRWMTRIGWKQLPTPYPRLPCWLLSWLTFLTPTPLAVLGRSSPTAWPNFIARSMSQPSTR